MLKRVLLLLLFLPVMPLWGACSKTHEELVAQHKGPITTIMKKVTALAPRVKATPRYGAQSVSPVKDMMLTRMGFGNTLFIHERDLPAPDHYVYAPERPRIANTFGCVNELTASTKGPYSPPLRPFEESLQACSRTKYVVVMRTHSRRMAKMIAGEYFMGGRVDGDVVAFTLAGHPLGGFPWHAESAEQVSVEQNASQSDMQMKLDFHMQDEVEAAIRAGMNRAFPGSAW